MTRTVKKRNRRRTPLERARDRFRRWSGEVGVNELGRILGVRGSHVTRIGKGERGVSPMMAKKIQRLRGIPAAHWFA